MHSVDEKSLYPYLTHVSCERVIVHKWVCMCIIVCYRVLCDVWKHLWHNGGELLLYSPAKCVIVARSSVQLVVP
jgi:hypothetical protein